MRVPLRSGPTGNSYMHLHGDDGTVVVEKEFDCEPLFEYASAMRNEVKQTGGLRKAMGVPAPLLFKWIQEGMLGECAWVNGSPVIDMQTLQKLYADPDYRKLCYMDKL